MERDYLRDISNTIIAQMGGAHRLMAMVGADNFVYGETDYEGFKQPMTYFRFKMNRKIYVCKVIYNQGSDTYVMQFIKATKNGMKVVKEYTDVFCDDLISLFEDTTGLYLFL